MRQSLGLPGGQLIANPIPVEAEIPLPQMSKIVDAALADAEAQKISAKAVTGKPRLIERL